MKRAAFLFALLAVLAGAAHAQQIRTSPLEGRWIWDGRRSDNAGYTELIFFGNVMLSMRENNPVYEGEFFSFTDRNINRGSNVVWRYRLSGNDLTITTDRDEIFYYRKGQMERSPPMEGIWRITGAAANEVGYFIFTGNVWAVYENASNFGGMKIDYTTRTFNISRSFPMDIARSAGETISNAELEDIIRAMTMEYRISGRTLVVSLYGEEMRAEKVY